MSARTLNIFLLSLCAAGVLALAVMLFSPFSSGSTEFNDPNPFPPEPELPSATAADYHNTLAAAQLELSRPQWEAAAEGRWRIAWVDLITRNGARIGVIADVEFGPPLDLPSPVEFRRCGQPELWHWPTPDPFYVPTIQLWLLDGTPEPFQVLPLIADGRLPTLEEVAILTGATGVSPCRIPAAN